MELGQGKGSGPPPLASASETNDQITEGKTWRGVGVGD